MNIAEIHYNENWITTYRSYSTLRNREIPVQLSENEKVHLFNTLRLTQLEIYEEARNNPIRIIAQKAGMEHRHPSGNYVESKVLIMRENVSTSILNFLTFDNIRVTNNTWHSVSDEKFREQK